ncbi:ribonuclease P protein subunit p21 [Hyposmocoma kahamanoa]|uniref:ribonuclease P protein subunit p21 n=1 Tax=Hyposmocoma kahamanoa TaxID=1477025 RepID=UPI000E6D71EB|nr:ribonuclease P protein subunit p21 [Hyposmocoma kahamanoa]
MKKVQGYDSFQRINYLYQASKCIAEKHPELSSYYGNLIVNLAKKNVLKMHPEIKRQICRKCRCILMNDSTAIIKMKNKRQSNIIEWTCKTCSTKKSYPIAKKKDHRVWVEKPEAVVEVIN